MSRKTIDRNELTSSARGRKKINDNFLELYSKQDTTSQDLINITNNGEIKGFKPVTQMEYDALTTEQKNDGTVYLIEEA